MEVNEYQDAYYQLKDEVATELPFEQERAEDED